MSTPEHSTLASPAAPDITLRSEPGAYLEPEIAVPDMDAESAPPSVENLRDLARMEYDANGVFESRRTAGSSKRESQAKRKKKLTQMLAVIAGAAVVGAIALGGSGIAPGPAPGPTPTPGPTPGTVTQSSAIRAILSEHPNWHSAEYDVYLHFNEGVGWLYDHGDFHRLVWTIRDEGADDEQLVIETGYSYLLTADGFWESNEFTSELQVVADGGSFTITGVTGIGFHDDASTTFAPVDTIDVNSTYVDRFGAMTGQQILETIGTFALHDSSIDPETRYDNLTFAGGMVTITSAWMEPVTVNANYQERLNGHIYTDDVMVYPADGGEPYEPGRLPGTIIIREDNVYFYFSGLHMLLEFVPGSMPEGITPEPVAPPAPVPVSGDYPTPSIVIDTTGSKMGNSFSAPAHARGEGTEICVAVYTDEWHLNGDFWGNHLIDDYKCPEEDFLFYSLPPLETINALIASDVEYEPVGYVLYYGPLQVTEDTYGTFYWAGDTEFAIMLYGNTITWDEVQFIPADEYGIRFANVHVVYAPKAADISEAPILADDGLGNITGYMTAATPFESAGVTWLGSLPEPEMAGYSFAGWFDEDGNQLWYVWNEDIYEYWYDSATDQSGVTMHPKKIIAGWVNVTDPAAMPN